MSRALLVVDVQNDFCEGGALAVQGGNAVAEKIGNLDVSSYALTVASMDWHKPLPDTNCGHFAVGSDPDYTTSWPVHCVEFTDGADVHRALDQIDFTWTVTKGHGTQSYSAFEGVNRNGHSLLALLRSNNVTDLDVCGLATDYCVKASVLDALGLGFNVRVLSGLCAGVDPTSSALAMEEMSDKGAYIVAGDAL